MDKFAVLKKRSLFGFLGAFAGLVTLTHQVSASVDITDLYRAAVRSGTTSASRPTVNTSQLETVQKSRPLSASEIYSRTQAVLKYFQVPIEQDYQSNIGAFDGFQSESGLKEMLAIFDPKSAFTGFSTINASQLSGFQDRDVKQVEDFTVQLREDSAPGPSASVALAHIKAAQSNPDDQPLAGLKIMLDPGHMGTTIWDERTGKFVTDEKGHTISEGVINLQTALLLQQKLQALGATVMLTRTALAPVLTQSYDTFDYETAARNELADESLTPWFQNLLTVGAPGDALYSAFSRNPDLKRLFSEEMRATLYNTADLEARADAIMNFQADIALMIHYDADYNHVNTAPAGTRDATKVYVTGSFDPTELATRYDRAEFAMHIADETPWRASVSLGHSILASMTSELHLPAEMSSPGITKLIEPGLFARNLALLKRHTGAVVDYVECLYYNDQREFQLISQTTHPMTIDGQSYPYSDRQMEVAEALKDGIVNYVKNYF